ncbi:unnamed protein product [Cylindrotheca closterium]|uniref:Phosphoribulokinase/uridine kinase domain-containing protein n=1 Tax=Cylindrotheca closterium TaxID=2856 RepID=A0AAD2CUV0_9STRA|nr:unnamed protein product [Cylindrotheca closterium]
MTTELIMVSKTDIAFEMISTTAPSVEVPTNKLGNLIVSWEPESAVKIRDEILEKRLEQRMQLEDGNSPLPRKPFMVGVVGIPGSGKSTSSEILSAFLHDSIVMPLDGYHTSMADLEKLPNAADAIYRRGAPDTFDPASLEKDLERIVNGKESHVSIPGFDHHKGDPEPNQHTFCRDAHSIVIAEGIYLMHQGDGWENIKSYFDHIVYIEVDVDTCVARLKERNKCIPGYTPEEIEIRCEVVDRANAETVVRSSCYASEKVHTFQAPSTPAAATTATTVVAAMSA